jgi:hypothetical protein
MFSPSYTRPDPSAPAIEEPQVSYTPRENYELQERQNSSLTDLLVSSENRSTRLEETLKLEIEKNQLLTQKIKTLEASYKEKYQQKMRAFISNRNR